MKNKKLHAFFTQASSGRKPVVIALLAGLAVVTVLGILFTSERGQKLKRRVRDLAGRTENDMPEGPEQIQNNHRGYIPHKRPKSDIRSLIHPGYTEEAHTEQGLSF
jgi:hypothetical protein